MTLAEIKKQYEVETDARGNTRIRSLGKFQSEPAYTVYFWDQFLNGCFDEDTAGSLFFIVTDEDRTEFPELTETYGIAISENNNGFVDSYRLKTQKEYDEAVKNCNELDEAESDEVS